MFKRILFLVLVLLALVAMPVSAQGPTDVRLATVGVDNVTVHVGDTFTVPVWIHGVTNLYGYDVRLPHDQDILQGVRVDHGGWLIPGFVIRMGFYEWTGPGCGGYCAWYAMTQLNPAPPVSGDGMLIYVTYRAVAPGVVTLQPWAQLSEAGGIPIAVTTKAATVRVVAVQPFCPWPLSPGGKCIAPA